MCAEEGEVQARDSGVDESTVASGCARVQVGTGLSYLASKH